MGFFVPDEKSFDNYECKTPEVPEMFKQAEAMIPMMKVMAKSNNKGTDPAWTQVVHDTWHNMAMVGAVVTEEYEATQYCKGMVYAFELRAIIHRITHPLLMYMVKDFEFPQIAMPALPELAMPTIEMPAMPEVHLPFLQ